MSNVALQARDVSLLEALDMLLHKGVVLNGDITISVADVDLIFVGLRVVLASVDTAERFQCGYKGGRHDALAGKTGEGGLFMPSNATKNTENNPSPPNKKDIGELSDEIGMQQVNAFIPEAGDHPDKVNHGLGRLVLTLVNLIRELMEKQAIRRMESGSISDEQIERLGETLMGLENKMEELKKVFGLSDEDLNLNLGPLGNLR